jgi:hypothetical protein
VTSEPAPYPGLLLHRARIAAGVKLRAAARAAGCSHTLLSLIETGKRRICLADGRLNLEATFQGGISIEKAVPLNYGGYPGLMLGTDCDQEHGQSGGPLYRMNNGKPFIIGVLHGDPHNFGVRSVFSSGTALTNLVDWARKQPA